MISRSWPLPALIIATVLAVAAPAGAAVLPLEATAPPAQSEPGATAPALEPLPAPYDAEPLPVPDQITPTAADPTAVPDASLPETTPAVPEATAEPDATAEPEEDGEKDLESLIGILGAKMGQGLERLEDTRDPQVPGDVEVAERIEAEQILIEENVADPELATPTDAASVSAPAAELTVAPASFARTAAREPAVSLAAVWSTPPGLQGMDVSSHQPAVNWSRAWNQGARYAYVKATEATSYTNPLFSSQTSGAVNSGMLRGAYHFAIPSVSSGASQANYFVNNGGRWTADGNTLPPLLDIEYNPYAELGNTCYNMSASQMVAWIRDFSATMVARTGRVPMIYTTTDWWSECTGNTSAFANHPLHIANYPSKEKPLPSNVPLPNGWGNYTLWQYSSTGPFEGDSNVYNGSLTQLRDFARGSRVSAPAKLFYRGNPVSSLNYGHTTDEFVTCDWDGDGVATPAAFRDGVWYIRNALTGTSPATELRYGEKGDLPICGDWDGDGVDTLGVYRNGMAYLRNSNTTGRADGTFAFGAAYDTPLVGDWNGDGFDTLGVARMEGVGKRFYLTDSNIRPSVSQSFIYGNAGDTPISGDWNNDRFDTVGVQRSNNWYLTDSHSSLVATSVFAFGNPDDRPLTGRWNRGAGTAVGVIR